MTTLIALAAVHLAAGWVLTRHAWQPRRLADLPPLWGLTALSTFYAGPILLGTLTGIISPWTVWTAALATAAAAAMVWRATRKIPSPFGWTELAERLRRTGWFERILWGGVAALLGATLVLGSALPMRYSDAVEYHSTNPQRWAESRRFDLRSFDAPPLKEGSNARETFANVKAVVPFLILDATGREDGTALAQWPFLVLLVLCSAGGFRRAGLRGWRLPCAVLFVLLAPEVLLQSLEAYADLAFFAAQTAVFYGCLLTWQEGVTKRSVFASAMGFAFLVGTKPTGLLLAAGLGTVFLGFAWVRMAHRPTRARLARTAGVLGVVLAACFALAGPWYLRSISEYANPVYPIRVQIGERVVFPGIYGSDVGNFYVRLHQKKTGFPAWWLMMNEAYRHPILANYRGGFGAHGFILGVPAALAFLGLGWRREGWSVYFPTVLVFATTMLLSPVWLWPRMALFLLALYALSFGWLLGQIPTFPRTVLLGAFLLLGTYNGLCTLPSILHRTRPPELVAYPYLTGYRQHLRTDTFPDEYTALDFWREEVAERGAVLALPRSWPWRARPFARGASVVRVPRLGEGESADAWADTLLECGATHLHVQRSLPEFDAAMARPERFRLLFHRSDSGAETPWSIFSSEEAALFALLPSHGRHP